MNKPKLLLVEDSRKTYVALMAFFRHGFDVQWAHDVSTGLSLLASRFDVIILDLMLDDEDGLSILKTVRLMDSAEGRHTPVIVTTGIPDGPHMDATLAEGPDKILRKPYTPEALDAALAPILSSVSG